MRGYALTCCLRVRSWRPSLCWEYSAPRVRQARAACRRRVACCCCCHVRGLLCRPAALPRRGERRSSSHAVRGERCGSSRALSRLLGAPAPLNATDARARPAGQVVQRRTLWRLSLIPELFWKLLNFLQFLCVPRRGGGTRCERAALAPPEACRSAARVRPPARRARRECARIAAMHVAALTRARVAPLRLQRAVDVCGA
jgi:hypothetical protein